MNIVSRAMTEHERTKGVEYSCGQPPTYITHCQLDIVVLAMPGCPPMHIDLIYDASKTGTTKVLLLKALAESPRAAAHVRMLSGQFICWLNSHSMAFLQMRVPGGDGRGKLIHRAVGF
ncbi:unnamed protein product [Haemonchus placei]|uniref:DEAD domain-containing protein n=1 Tax=Haemonchus placei TaxID=6290 RepID=A0A0N4WHQ2_HAEPC|nr:unnamed protein product [Haemonchus placei]